MNGIISRNEVFDMSRVTNEQNEAFRKLMRDARLRKGWRTQEEAGKAIGVSQSLISSFESRGLYDGMRFLDFRKVLLAYGITWFEIERIFGDLGQTGDERRAGIREVLMDKFQRVPEARRDEVLRALEMLLDGYAR